MFAKLIHDAFKNTNTPKHEVLRLHKQGATSVFMLNHEVDEIWGLIATGDNKGVVSVMKGNPEILLVSTNRMSSTEVLTGRALDSVRSPVLLWEMYGNYIGVDYHTPAASRQFIAEFIEALIDAQTVKRPQFIPSAQDHAPLSDFQEGQWWITELDAAASAPEAKPEFKRAVSTVHHLLRSVRAAEVANVKPS